MENRNKRERNECFEYCLPLTQKRSSLLNLTKGKKVDQQKLHFNRYEHGRVRIGYLLYYEWYKRRVDDAIQNHFCSAQSIISG